MSRSSEYRGGLTQEQFLFYESRIVARFLEESLSKDEILAKIKSDNLFQYPTERKVNDITYACIRRLETLDSLQLISELAHGDVEIAKQINLYSMMRYNKLVWDFMVTVIGEKYRTQDFEFTNQDMNVFFMGLQEQNDDIASWSESTITKIKQVLRKSLVECGFLDTTKSTTLNPVFLYDELMQGMRNNDDSAAFVAFNYFE